MFQSVIFDLDGTLLDTLEDLAAAGNYTLSAMGLPTHPVDAYRQMVGNGIPNLLRRMLPEQNRGEATCALAQTLFRPYYAAHMQDYTTPYPGVVSLLAQLKERGVATGVLSNKADDFVQQIVQQYFPDLIGAALGLREDFPAKPDPSSALHLLQVLDAEPSRTLYCGDSDVDMHTAANAGIPSCGVLWGFRDEDELAGAGAAYLAADIPALSALILG